MNKLHAEMGEMGAGCDVCHHYSPAGEMPACQQCHGVDSNDTYNLRQPGLKGAYHRQCLNCHREWSHEGFNHKRTGIELDETHVELDCQDCHIEGIGQPASCQACHDDEMHAFPPSEGQSTSRS